MKKFLKIALVFFLSVSIFFGCSYFYLYKSLKNAEKPTGKTKENVPYYELPENCGLHFSLPGEKGLLIFLDFETEIAYIIDIDKDNGSKGNYAGYTSDYDFTLDYSVLSEIFDRVGGLDLESGGEQLRFTGVQVCDALCVNTSPEFTFDVASAFCKKISENGFSDDDFVYLLENTNTRLTLPVCLYWQGRIKTLFANAVFVNWVI